jgi:threonine/homoserine/homoserine lactone efflux protein
MKTFLVILMVLLMLAVLATLFAGLFTLARPNHDPMRSNTFMRWRVILQGAALLVFALLMGLYKSS